MQNGPIGIFDSGVGGLSVLRAVHAALPQENLVYFADQAHVPYGRRTRDELRRLSREITRFLQTLPIKLLIVACNTASAAALTYLRELFPALPIVGMEPAVKPAAQQTRSGTVGVLATAVTFESERYAGLMHRFTRHVRVIEDPCAGLVELIEAGAVDGPETRALLQRVLAPMLAQNADTLVLGCTHYPFVAPLIRELVDPGVTLIDPAPAVARQAARLLAQHDLHNGQKQPGTTRLFTSGDPAALADFAARTLGLRAAAEHVVWTDGVLSLSPP
jgi:glutamate racemase